MINLRNFNLKFVAAVLLLTVINCFGQINIYLYDKVNCLSSQITNLTISNDGRFLSYGTNTGSIYLYDIEAKRELKELKLHTSEITALIFDSKNKYLISGSKDENIVIWDLYSGASYKTINQFEDEIYSLALSPDDNTLAVSGNKNEIYLYDFPIGELRGKLEGHEDDVPFISFNINGNQLYSLGVDKNLIVWDASKQSLLRKTQIAVKTISNSGFEIVAGFISFDKSIIALGLQEHALEKGGRGMIFKHNVSFFNIADGNEIITMEGLNKDSKQLVISPDKNYLFADNSTLRDKQISIYNTQNSKQVNNIVIDDDITAMNIAENGKWFAAACEDINNSENAVIKIWQLSGVSGYNRFSNEPIKQSNLTNLGSSIKINTPANPLISFGDKNNVAIIKFESVGLSEDIAKTAAYLLESKLSNSSFINVIERNNIDKVVSELKYQLSGLTTSDAAELGKHLNAQYVILGSLNKLGNLMIITAKLVNVETAKIEGTREVQCQNGTIENISEMIDALAPTITKY